MERGEPTAEVTALGSGMMAHAARLLLSFPEYQQRAQELYNKAKLAFDALSNFKDEEGQAYLDSSTSSLLYASIQHALAIEAFEAENRISRKKHEHRFTELATDLLVKDGYWPEQYRPGNITAKIQTVHFSSFPYNGR